MKEIIVKAISVFVKETGIEDNFLIREDALNYVFFIVGLLLLLGGARTYRLIHSLLVFGVITILLCVTMKDHAEWGSIVTAFTILGSILGFAAFNWKLAGASVVSGAIVLGIMWEMEFTWLLLSLVVMAIVFTGYFPLVGIIFFTSIAGASMITEAFLGSSVWIGFFIGVAGILLQYFLFGRKQKFFKKVMPDRVKYWLENRGQER